MKCGTGGIVEECGGGDKHGRTPSPPDPVRGRLLRGASPRKRVFSSFPWEEPVLNLGLDPDRGLIQDVMYS